MNITSMVTGPIEALASNRGAVRRSGARLRQLHEALLAADSDVEAAQQLLAFAAQMKSEVLKQLLNEFGAGPHTYRGQRVAIVSRRTRRHGVVYFLRGWRSATIPPAAPAPATASNGSHARHGHS